MKKNGKKVAGVGMICTLIIQAVYLGIYSYFYLVSPDKQIYTSMRPKNLTKIDRPMCCFAKNNWEITTANKNAVIGVQCTDSM